MRVRVLNESRERGLAVLRAISRTVRAALPGVF
jgi:hypothetical protein